MVRGAQNTVQQAALRRFLDTMRIDIVRLKEYTASREVCHFLYIKCKDKRR